MHGVPALCRLHPGPQQRVHGARRLSQVDSGSGRSQGWERPDLRPSWI
ncbi:hypothetical protein LDO98_15970 [Paenarthrobacter aurescens]|nr:hypothetical protein [Paenarthrobacter aurescens]MDO6148617.1 hypothetical protein [Paenarthrobacter aurescens]MDO6159863.1 hypothetical protein [Paenarthrobacter aurescens]MDO6163722.1 hypothetical protein [Paenarthrobacter aurescens]UKA52089.1 hypothetical protein LFT48_17165 [Arthrobacter sp. FW305-123]